MLKDHDNHTLLHMHMIFTLGKKSFLLAFIKILIYFKFAFKLWLVSFENSQFSAHQLKSFHTKRIIPTLIPSQCPLFVVSLLSPLSPSFPLLVSRPHLYSVLSLNYSLLRPYSLYDTKSFKSCKIQTDNTQ